MLNKLWYKRDFIQGQKAATSSCDKVIIYPDALLLANANLFCTKQRHPEIWMETMSCLNLHHAGKELYANTSILHKSQIILMVNSINFSPKQINTTFSFQQPKKRLIIFTYVLLYRVILLTQQEAATPIGTQLIQQHMDGRPNKTHRSILVSLFLHALLHCRSSPPCVRLICMLMGA